MIFSGGERRRLSRLTSPLLGVNRAGNYARSSFTTFGNRITAHRSRATFFKREIFGDSLPYVLSVLGKALQERNVDKGEGVYMSNTT